MLKPRLRALDITRVQQDGRDGIVLQDPARVMPDAVFVPIGLLPLLEYFDGEHSPEEIARALTRAHKTEVSTALVEKIMQDLDQRLCLMGERFDQALRDKRGQFAALPARPPAHAGSAGYPEDPALLASELDRILAEGTFQAESQVPLRAVIAPHIDLMRGRRTYAEAYRAVAAAGVPDLFVLFGTAHAGPSSPLLPTRKDFLTPLGRVRTDTEFVDRVAGMLGPTAYDEELLHAHEHSLEFQALLLQHLFGGKELRIAPFLCGSLPSGGNSPGGEQYVERMVAAIRAAAAARGGSVCFLAGADLAHVGPHFGDAEPLDDQDLTRLRQADLRSLELCAKGDAEGFYASVMADGNRRRICGTVPIYLALRCSGATRGLLQHYEQSVSDQGALCVSHAAMVFAE
jgi:AmmeMemoRadiSam system protein B